MDGITTVFKAKQVSCSFCVGNTGDFMLILRWIILSIDKFDELFIEFPQTGVAQLKIQQSATANSEVYKGIK
jgi:hypothetical protein